MIAAWMVYALMVGALASGGALVLDRLLRAHRSSTRWVWAGSMALSVVWPAIHLLLDTRPRGTVPALPDPRWAVALDPLTVQVGPRSVLHALNEPLLTGWILASLILLAAAVFVVVRTERLRRGWKRDEADGRRVLLSEDWGPAVVGFFRPQIVLPGWCRELDDEALSLILDHEAEHLRAGDLRLLLLAGALPLLFPWHLVLWWQVARLRDAAEADCDLRVLRRHPQRVRSYMELLLEVGRRPPRRELAAAMMSEPETTLARRIRAMTAPFPRNPWARGVLLAGIGGILVAVACWAPAPMGIEEIVGEPEAEGVVLADRPVGDVADLGQEADLSAGPAFTPFTVPPQITNRDQVARALEAEYPPLLKDAAIGGTVNVWFYLNEDGAVLRTLVDKSSGHKALDEAALRVANLVTFSPALNGEKKVPAWISLPITFAVGEEAPTRKDLPPAIDLPPPPSGGAVATEARPSDPTELPPPPQGRTADISSTPTFTPYTVRPDIRNRRDVAQALEREYPPLLRDAGIGGTAHIWFFVDVDGTVRRSVVDETSGHEALDEAALRVADIIRFTPALNRDKPVPVWISLPITFTAR